MRDITTGSKKVYKIDINYKSLIAWVIMYNLGLW